jgi:hypothetical protein
MVPSASVPNPLKVASLVGRVTLKSGPALAVGGKLVALLITLKLMVAAVPAVPVPPPQKME